MLGNNKKKLRKLIPEIAKILAKLNLSLKENYQVFPIKKRGIDMLGFRFWHNKILLRKRNALHIMKAVRKWNKLKTPHRARSILSSIGNKKWFNSKNFFTKYFANLSRKELEKYANRHNRNARKRI